MLSLNSEQNHFLHINFFITWEVTSRRADLFIKWIPTTIAYKIDIYEHRTDIWQLHHKFLLLIQF